MLNLRWVLLHAQVNRVEALSWRAYGCARREAHLVSLARKKELKVARKGTGHPTSLCRRLRISVPLTGTPPTYKIVHGTHFYLFNHTDIQRSADNLPWKINFLSSRCRPWLCIKETLFKEGYITLRLLDT